VMNNVSGSGNKTSGMRNHVLGSGNNTQGGMHWVSGSGNKTQGTGHCVVGTGNTVDGTGHIVVGHPGNTVTAANNVVLGRRCTVLGTGCVVVSDDIHVAAGVRGALVLGVRLRINEVDAAAAAAAAVVLGTDKTDPGTFYYDYDTTDVLRACVARATAIATRNELIGDAAHNELIGDASRRVNVAIRVATNMIEHLYQMNPAVPARLPRALLPVSYQVEFSQGGGEFVVREGAPSSNTVVLRSQEMAASAPRRRYPEPWAEEPTEAPEGTAPEDHCVACQDRVACCVVDGCGHRCLCVTCALKLAAGEARAERCPICRHDYTGITRIR